MNMSLLLAAIPLFFLQACMAITAPLPVMRPPELTTCGAIDLQDLVGQNISVTEGLALPTFTRIIRPGQRITMDLMPQRLNFDLDTADIIIRIWCG